MNLFELPVGEYAEKLASSDPAPGGGTAAALSGAQGAALVRMVALVTLGNYKYSPFFHLCREVSRNCEEYYPQLLAAMQLDSDAYFTLADSFKLPRSTVEEIAARSAQIQEATRYAAYIPLRTMTLGAEVLEEAFRLVDHSNPNCASDLGVAAECLRACVIGAYLNVRINLASLKDEEMKQNLLLSSKEQYDTAMDLYEKISCAVSRSIG